MKKIITALLAGYLCAAAWTIYADIVYNNQVPLDAVLFHGLYPISLGACALLTLLIHDGNLKDIGFRRFRIRHLFSAIGIAAVATLLPFLINLLFGFIGMNEAPAFDEGLIAIGIPVLMILGLGEEVMWRGLLYTNLSRRYSFARTSVVIGVMWAVWHYPIIIHTRFVYGDRPLGFALVMFTMLCICFSFVYNYLRAASRSIWPCVILHAFMNYFGFVLVEPMEAVRGESGYIFRSDIGVVYLLVAAAMALLAWKRTIPLRAPRHAGAASRDGSVLATME